MGELAKKLMDVTSNPQTVSSTVKQIISTIESDDNFGKCFLTCIFAHTKSQ